MTGTLGALSRSTAALVPLAASGGEAAGVSSLQAVVATALVVVGLFFLAVGTVGLLRLPNVYNRLHATSKATTLGAASLFLAGYVRFGPAGAGLTSLIGIVFLFLTAPTGAHMISGAAKEMGVEFVESASWPTLPGERDEDEGVGDGDGDGGADREPAAE